MKSVFHVLIMSLLAMRMIVSAAAGETVVDPAYQPFPYSLSVNGACYDGTTVVSPIPADGVSELAAKGYTIGREDAQAIFHLLGVAGESMDEHHIKRENSHHYSIGNAELSVSDAHIQYRYDDDMMNHYVDAYVHFSSFWQDWWDPDFFTKVYFGLDIDWKELPEIRQTGFADRIEEVYAVLDYLNMTVGNPETIVFYDAQTLQNNVAVLHDPPLTDYIFKESDALMEIAMPVYWDGMRLKVEQIGMPDELNAANCNTEVVARFTEDRVMELYINYNKFLTPKKTRSGEAIPVAQVMERYQAYLSQSLAVPENRTEILAVLLEYNVWFKYQAGIFEQTFHFVPVWSVYTKQDYPVPTVMFDALTGEALPW